MGIVSLGTHNTQHSTLNMSKEWNHGTFSCCDDMGTCCFSYWCGCCQIYNTAEDLGKSGCLYLLMTMFITPCIPIMLLRTEARERYDIQTKEMTPSVPVAVDSVPWSRLCRR